MNEHLEVLYRKARVGVLQHGLDRQIIHLLNGCNLALDGGRLAGKDICIPKRKPDCQDDIICVERLAVEPLHAIA